MSKPWTPQRLLVPCPDCGQTVLRGLWQGDLGKWKKLEPPQMPVSGTPHQCDEAVALMLRVQGLRWQAIRMVQYMAEVDAQREAKPAKEQ